MADGYIVVGRAKDCDVVLEHPSVSGRHASMRWDEGRILVEDLGSANGTFVDGQRITRVHIRPGGDLVLGLARLPWSDPRLYAFMRRGQTGATMQGLRIPGRRFICGVCNARGVLPPGFTRGELACGRCGSQLVLGGPGRARWGAWLALGLLLSVALGATLAYALAPERAREAIAGLGERLGIASIDHRPPPTSPEERSIRERVAPRVIAAIDASNPTTRNLAVQIASGEQGPFHVEQVARIWSHVRREFDYVNDPAGGEYFATASETIGNGFAGDCDDFATVLAAMVTAIGGEARIVMVDGDQGGHAYAEVCVHAPPDEVADHLARHYRQHWDRALGPTPVHDIHFRSDAACPVWLNLDWNARVPGGPYGRELWAVAIRTDGRTETLSPAGGDAPAESRDGPVQASSMPRE